MAVEKEGSKAGGSYAGGFFHLFDWTAKSRKKLFSSKSDIAEQSKRGKICEGNSSMRQVLSYFQIDHDDETGAGSSIKGSSDYSCASSAIDDEGYVAKAPGVVARLMGLDSLPSSNLSETCSTSSFDTQSLRDANYYRNDFHYHHDFHSMCPTKFLNNMEGPVRNSVESKPQKLPCRPIEKFQTEVLPPKSAKSIPVTHHKLLSPIKSHGFIPSKNAAHIMEAAAKIIDPVPLTATRGKMPQVGSSSVPLKVRAPKENVEAPRKLPLVGSSATQQVKVFREKVEASHKSSRLSEASRRPVESSAAKCMNGHSTSKSWNGFSDASYNASPDTGVDSCGSKLKGKSISLAIQAKVNVQRREGLSSNGNRSLAGQKEQVEKSSQPFKSQPTVQKTSHKKLSSRNASGVLRQNNQKQNLVVDREKVPSKPSAINFKSRKLLTGSSAIGHQKSSVRVTESSKIGVRRSGLDVTDREKEDCYSSSKNFPRKKRSIDREFHPDKNQVVDDTSSDRSHIPFSSNTIVERPIDWGEESRRNGTDIVSFTFTAPLTRPMPGAGTSGQVIKRNNVLPTVNRGKRVFLDSDSMQLPSVGYNVIEGDTLGVLLEKKLQDLSNGVESSHYDSLKMRRANSSASIVQDLTPNFEINLITRSKDKRNLSLLVHDTLERLDGSCEIPSTNSPIFRFKHKLQGAADMDECSHNSTDAGRLFSGRHPSPVSILEPYFSSESCDSSLSADSNSLEGSKSCSSVQPQELVSPKSSKVSSLVDGDSELTDSASSISTTGALVRKRATTLTLVELPGSFDWELEYVKEIICHAELMFTDFKLYQAREIINPRLFDQLETRKGVFSNEGRQPRYRRKLLFDCVSERLDLRCKRYAGAGYKTWEKGVAILSQKEWLAEEIYKEILGLKGMGDCMVDELVDKDMSSQHGRWLDFEVDAFVLGVEVEGLILNSLFDDVFADIMQF